MNRKPSYVGQAQSTYVDRCYREQQQDKAKVNWDGAHYLLLQARAQEQRRRGLYDSPLWQGGDYEPYDGQENND